MELDFRVIPGGHTLTGSPVRVNFQSSEAAAAIRDLCEATDKIFAELWLLRDRVRQMTPREVYTVENYDPWARQYQKALAAAPDRLEGLLPTDGSPLPLVSIICPAYKPRLRDFTAAVPVGPCANVLALGTDHRGRCQRVGGTDTVHCGLQAAGQPN